MPCWLLSFIWPTGLTCDARRGRQVTGLALKSSKNMWAKGLLQRLCRGVATAALFSVDLNTKSICPNPWGQSAPITKFPLAGIWRCPSVEPKPLHNQAEATGQGVLKDNISGRYLSCACPRGRRKHPGLMPVKHKSGVTTLCRSSKVVTRRTMRTSSFSPFPMLLSNNSS